MPRWKLLIVDDEALARSNLQLALAEHPAWELCGLAASAAEARVAMASRPADLVLLDIQMPRQNGLAYAAELARLPEPPLVVFVTAHDEHALAAFEVHALDYLLKPWSDTRLAQALQRAAQLLERQQRSGYAQAMQAMLREQAAQAAASSLLHWRRSSCARWAAWSVSRWPASGGWPRPATTSSCTCRTAACFTVPP
jgi:two-component system LytT family response regulator